LVKVPGVTTTAELVAVVRFSDVSVARSVQLVPVSMVTALKVATPATATSDSVPASVHEEVMATVSVDPVPVVSTALVASSTETVKLDNGAPALVGVPGSDVKATFAGAPAAEAGDAVTSSALPAKRAEHAPTERTLLKVERSDRPPPRFFNIAMVNPALK
jgi:hypothetical protein